MKKLFTFSGSWLVASAILASSNLTLLSPDPDLIPPEGDPIPKEHLLEILGITNIPYAPVSIALPTPPPMPEFSDTVFIVYTATVYAVEYQTNVANGVITETRTVDATNYVPRYPKMFYIQPQFKEALTDEWQNLGMEHIYKLGDSTNGFYSAKLRIE